MTLVRIELTRPGPLDEPVPANGYVELRPTKRRHIEDEPDPGDDYIVLPAAFNVRLGTAYDETHPATPGVAWAEMAATEPGWAWECVERTDRGHTRYVLVPDQVTANYGDLVDVDPETLDPTVEPPEPAWTVEVDNLQEQIDSIEIGGLPTGGTAGEVLTKLSSTDGDADWQPSAGGGGAVDSVNGQTGVVSLDAADVGAAADDDPRLSDSRTPTGGAGGVLSGTYPNPAFAVDMAEQSELDAHTSNTSNPHSVTKAQVGLANVDNTADAAKPVSTATQTALNLKANTADLGTAAAADTTDFATAAQGATADSAVQPGDLGAVATSNDYGDLDNLPTIPAQVNLIEGANIDITGTYPNLTINGAAAGEGGVDSVNGQTGAVVLDPDDLDDTATTNKFVTAADVTKLGNLSGTNTGDQDLSGLVPKTTTVNGEPLSGNVTLDAADVGAATAAQGALADTASQPGHTHVEGDVTGLTAALAAKADEADLGTAAAADATDFATAAQGATADSAVQPGDLSTVATTGAYSDLTGKPTLGTAAATAATDYATAAQGALADTATQPGDLGTAATADASDFATAAQGATADTAVQPADLATVATTGDYDDLTGKPTLGTAAATAATDYATAAQGGKADSAVQKPDGPEKTYYVTPRGDDSNDGFTLKTAKLTIAGAISAGGANPIRIILGEGSFSLSAVSTFVTGSVIEGAGQLLTILNYSGTGNMFAQSTPGTRVYRTVFKNLTLVGPGSGTATTGINLDSVSAGALENVLVQDFGTGIRIGSSVSGGSVYNTFKNVTVSTCGTGFKLESGTNSTQFWACRANGCTIGVDITDCNANFWTGGAIENCTTAWKITSTTNGLADLNTLSLVRLENNTTDANITSANVRDAHFIYPLVVDSFGLTDSGTRTFLWGDTEQTNKHWAYASPANGAWRFDRTTSGGSNVPGFVIADSNTGAGTPTTLQIETGRLAGSFLRGNRGGTTYLDAGADGSLRLAAGLYFGAGFTGPRILFGSGTPEGVVTAAVGSVFLRSDGGAGTTLYRKESGSGNTGWVAAAVASTAETLTNKRITKRVLSTADTATLTIDSDAYDAAKVTALAQAMTIAAPTGTPTGFQSLIIRILDNGTARALTWNAAFRAIGVTLPTTTVISKTIYVGCVWNSDASKWDAIAVAVQA